MYIANADGTGAKELMPNDPNKQYSPDFSPDGSKIAYVAYETNLEKVYIVNIDGTGKRRLTTATEGRECGLHGSPDGTTISKMYGPHWSPDGTKIVYNGNVVAQTQASSKSVSATSTPEEAQARTDGKSTPGFGVIGISMVLLVHLLMRWRRS